MRRERCVCGGYITADPRDPTEAVARHNASEMHLLWRYGERHQCAGDGVRSCPVMVPEPRARCRFCRRTMALREASVAA